MNAVLVVPVDWRVRCRGDTEHKPFIDRIEACSQAQSQLETELEHVRLQATAFLERYGEYVRV